MQRTRAAALTVLLMTSCTETGNRRDEPALKPRGDGGHCMGLAHDCSLCDPTGKTLDSPCDDCTKYKAECK